MANGDFFDTFLRGASNYNGGEPEFFEDAHDANGNYTGGHRAGGNMGYAAPTQPQPQYTQAPSAAAQRTEYTLNTPPQFVKFTQNKNGAPQPMPLPTVDQYISPQLNQNIVLYHPRTTADVEQLIAYLRRREPALVDFDPIADEPEAQRLMDFTSGAAYALGDRIMMIRRNLFLITPDTIDVLKPEDEK